MNVQKALVQGFHFNKQVGYWIFFIFLLATATGVFADSADNISQFGITWKFDKAYPVGQFVNGDWWVVGPVNVVSVTPAPGPAAADEQFAVAKSRYGATGTKDDKQMRNGSMIIVGRDLEDDKNGTGFGFQGYDSRGLNYSPKLSIAFPLNLEVNRSLISSISTNTYDKDGKPSCPTVYAGFPPRINCAPSACTVMTAVAVLTCLDKAPPADAFRPPYVGTEKPIYESKDIQWDLLPNLKAPDSTPDWAIMERVFERPWLDHIDGWGYSFCHPASNMPDYGREYARMTSMAGLMLLLDVPREKKQKLMIEYVQLGIDLHGLAVCGRNWISSDGGHWIGRKWPILFAGIMLNDEKLRTFPLVDMNMAVFGRLRITPTVNGPPPTMDMLFCEDTDTYYGKGGDGQTALGRTTFHYAPRLPIEEKPRAQYEQEEKLLNGYRIQNATAWNGEALAALLMKAKAMWNHDAYFDYVDRMMGPDPESDFPKWLPKGCTRTEDLFLDDMWNAYRKAAPEQPGGKDNLKWSWNDDLKGGHFEANPKPDANPKPAN